MAGRRVGIGLACVLEVARRGYTSVGSVRATAKARATLLATTSEPLPLDTELTLEVTPPGAAAPIALGVSEERAGVDVAIQLVPTATISGTISSPAAEVLRAANPSLVYCAITGYGQDGPLRDRAGHDMNYLGRIGLLGLEISLFMTAFGLIHSVHPDGSLSLPWLLSGFERDAALQWCAGYVVLAPDACRRKLADLHHRRVADGLENAAVFGHGYFRFLRSFTVKSPVKSRSWCPFSALASRRPSSASSKARSEG